MSRAGKPTPGPNSVRMKRLASVRSRWLIFGVAIVVTLVEAWCVACVSRAPTNAGTHFAEPEEPYEGPRPRNKLMDVDFADAERGWAVGSRTTATPAGATKGLPADGMILRTSDGGGTWSVQATDAWPAFDAVAFADARTGWVVGGHMVLRTTDGGTTWQQQDLGPATGSFHDVEAVDPNTAWVVSNAVERSKDTTNPYTMKPALEATATVYRTTDGGATWDRTRIATDESIADIEFSDATHGWLAVDRQTKPEPGWEGRILGGGFVWPDRWRILRTTDGGATWDFRRDGAGRLWHVAAPTQAEVHAVGEPHESGSDIGIGRVFSVLATEATPAWVQVWLPVKRIRTLGIDFADRQKGWVTGDADNQGVLLRTTDGGTTWNRMVVVPAPTLRRVAAIDRKNAVAVGSRGTIVWVRDGSAGFYGSRVTMGGLLFETVKVETRSPGALAEGWRRVRITISITNVGTSDVVYLPNPNTLRVRVGNTVYRSIDRERRGVRIALLGTAYERDPESELPNDTRDTGFRIMPWQLEPGDRGHVIVDLDIEDHVTNGAVIMDRGDLRHVALWSWW